MKYLEITDQYVNAKEFIIEKQDYFIDNQGNCYKVDGKYVVLEPTQREMEVARIIGEIFGGQIKVIPKVNKPFGIKTPDYIVNDEKFDLKEIVGGGKYAIQGNLKGKEKQSNNFIIDISNAKFDIKETRRQVENIYNSKHYLWLDKIIIVQKEQVENIFKRV